MSVFVWDMLSFLELILECSWWMSWLIVRVRLVVMVLVEMLGLCGGFMW